MQRGKYTYICSYVQKCFLSNKIHVKAGNLLTEPGPGVLSEEAHGRGRREGGFSGVLCAFIIFDSLDETVLLVYFGFFNLI